MFADIASRRVFDRLELALAGNASPFRIHRFGRPGPDPVEPVGPPATLLLRRSFDEAFERAARTVVDPVAIFVRRGRVDDAGDMARSGKHEPLLAREMVHDLPHA